MKKTSKKKIRIAVVVSRFNQKITDKMFLGAMEFLREKGVKDAFIKVVSVPGAYEIPLACQKIAEEKKFDGIVALGCVMKGETDHYYYVAAEASRGVMQVMLDFSIPIGFGIIMVQNMKLALARSRGKNNKGREAAEAMLEMIEKF